jgi:hypothetical protein
MIGTIAPVGSIKSRVQWLRCFHGRVASTVLLYCSIELLLTNNLQTHYDYYSMPYLQLTIPSMECVVQALNNTYLPSFIQQTPFGK